METGVLIWFTGVPASGKSTVGREVAKALGKRGVPVETLDAEEVRSNISPDLGFTPEDRDLNTKRLAFLGKLLTRNGVWAIVAAVSSLRKFRDRARDQVDKFVEVWVDCPIDVCKKRDPSGLYARAERGEVNDIAGLHQPYEEPLKPEVVLHTHEETVEQSAQKVLKRLEELGYLPKEKGVEEEAKSVYTKEDEEKIKERLRSLGYL